MGFLDWFLGQPVEVERQDRLEINVSDRAGSSRNRKNVKIEEEMTSSIKKLAEFYRTIGVKFDDRDVNQETFIKKVAPKSDKHTCPYCGVVHDFSASRARKCPDCKENMIVRSGRYLSQDQVDKMERIQHAYYDKSHWVDRLKSSIENAQREQKEHDYTRGLIAIAEGFQSCAIIHNVAHADDRNFTFWDYSWQSLQGATQASVENSSNDSLENLVWNGYLDAIYAKGEQCMRELKYAEGVKAKKRHASIAISMFYNFLTETVWLRDDDNWRREDAIKMIYIAKALGNLDNSEFSDLKEHAISSSKQKSKISAARRAVKEVEDYIFLETNPEKLIWMII